MKNFRSYINKLTNLRLPDGSHHTVMTCVLESPRPLLPQISTYGSMVKSIASSRAIPMPTFRRMAEARYFWNETPIYAHQPGMANDTELPQDEADKAREIFKSSFQTALFCHKQLEQLGVSKGQANRILEPFMTVDIVATASMWQWEHIFNQRIFKDGAQQEWKMVLNPIIEQLKTVEPIERGYHIPMITEAEEYLPIEKQLIMSIKRCAAASYSRAEQEFDFESACKTASVCIKSEHASTYEHQWFVDPDGSEYSRTRHLKVQPLRNMKSLLEKTYNEAQKHLKGDQIC